MIQFTPETQETRLRSKKLVNSEERIKPNKTGGTRYKVYFALDLADAKGASESLENMSSVIQSSTGRDMQTLDTQNPADLDVQRPEPLLSPCSDHPGQDNNVKQQTQNLQHQDLQNLQDSSIHRGDRVYYCGSKNIFKNLCLSKALTVVNVEAGIAECSFDTWLVTQKIPVNDLKKISKLPEK